MAFCIACSFPNSDRVSHRWRDAEIDDEAYKPLRTLLAAQYARSADEPLVVTFTSRARDLWREISDNLYAEAEARDFPRRIDWAMGEVGGVRYPSGARAPPHALRVRREH
jgi:hypothetical protein